MKIKQIRITNFKAVRFFDWVPRRVNVLIGMNGSGKTSIMQAVRYGLTGIAPNDAIAGDATKAVVELSLDGIGILTRTLSPGKNEVRLNGRVTTQKSIQKLFADVTGSSATTAELLTSAQSLIGRTNAELSSYFLQNMDTFIDFELLTGFCNLSNEAKEQLKELFGDGQIRISDIERVWNEAKVRRKFLRQEVKEAEIRAQDKGSPVSESAEEIDKSLRLLLQKQGEMQEIQRRYQQISQQRTRILAAIHTKKEQMGAIISKPDSSLLEQYSKELERIGKDMQDKKGMMATLLETGRQLTTILEELSSATCPISRKLVCTTNKSSIRKELTTALESTRVQYKELRGKMHVLESEQDRFLEKRRLLEEQIHTYHTQELLQQQITSLTESLPEEPERPSDSHLDQITQQIEVLSQKQTLVIRHLNALEYKDLLKKRAKELSLFEEIVRELDPKAGVRQQILAHSLKPLEDYFNDGLRRLLPKYRVRLDCCNGFTIKISDGKREYDAAQSASSGEQSRIWFALMDLINALSSYRILLYDYTDAMDASSLLNLLDVLNSGELQSRYDHLFVSMIDHQEIKQKLTELNDVSVIWIDQGRVQRETAA